MDSEVESSTENGEQREKLPSQRRFDWRLYNVFIVGLAFMLIFGAFQTSANAAVSFRNFVGFLLNADLKVDFESESNQICPIVLDWRPKIQNQRVPVIEMQTKLQVTGPNVVKAPSTFSADTRFQRPWI